MVQNLFLLFIFLCSAVHQEQHMPLSAMMLKHWQKNIEPEQFLGKKTCKDIVPMVFSLSINILY